MGKMQETVWVSVTTGTIRCARLQSKSSPPTNLQPTLYRPNPFVSLTYRSATSTGTHSNDFAEFHSGIQM